MHPLNHVVTNIHWIDIRWHHFDTKCIFVSNRSKRLIPPTRSFNQRRTNRLRRSAIDVINNRLHWFTDCGVWILLLQTMPSDETFRDWLLDWRRKIHKRNPGETSTRIKYARLETWPGQLHKRMSLTHRYCFGRGDNLSNKLACWLPAES